MIGSPSGVDGREPHQGSASTGSPRASVRAASGNTSSSWRGFGGSSGLAISTPVKQPHGAVAHGREHIGAAGVVDRAREVPRHPKVPVVAPLRREGEAVAEKAGERAAPGPGRQDGLPRRERAAGPVEGDRFAVRLDAGAGRLDPPAASRQEGGEIAGDEFARPIHRAGFGKEQGARETSG